MSNILIVSHSCDAATNDVISFLTELGASWFRINLDRCAYEIRYGWRLKDPDCPPSTQVRYDDRTWSGESVGVVWYRKTPQTRVPPGFSPHEEAFIRREVREFWRGVFGLLEPATWVNDRRATTVTKPEQLAAARRVGLQIPATFAGNDPEAAREFIREYGPVVVAKPVSWGLIGSLHDFDIDVEDGRQGEPPRFAFTRLVGLDDVQEDASLLLSPMILQPVVSKHRELRITVVGECIFPVAFESSVIQSASLDWRRVGAEITRIPHAAHELPEEVSTGIRLLMHELNLTFGCIDMILTPAGEYIFLEVNPQGQYGWLEELLGLPISRTLAAMLCSLADSAAVGERSRGKPLPTQQCGAESRVTSGGPIQVPKA